MKINSYLREKKSNAFLSLWTVLKENQYLKENMVCLAIVAACFSLGFRDGGEPSVAGLVLANICLLGTCGQWKQCYVPDRISFPFPSDFEHTSTQTKWHSPCVPHPHVGWDSPPEKNDVAPILQVFKGPEGRRTWNERKNDRDCAE